MTDESKELSSAIVQRVAERVADEHRRAARLHRIVSAAMFLVMAPMVFAMPAAILAAGGLPTLLGASSYIMSRSRERQRKQAMLVADAAAKHPELVWTQDRGFIQGLVDTEVLELPGKVEKADLRNALPAARVIKD